MSNKPMKNPPSYVKVQNYILEKCKSGEYAIGSRIPSETELARMFSVSRITANKAVSELALKGILKRIRGKGSFVVSRVSAEGNKSQAFSAAVITNISEGKKHEMSQFRVLTTCPELAQKLNLPANESFYETIKKQTSESYQTILPFLALFLLFFFVFVQSKLPLADLAVSSSLVSQISHNHLFS